VDKGRSRKRFEECVIAVCVSFTMSPLFFRMKNVGLGFVRVYLRLLY